MSDCCRPRFPPLRDSHSGLGSAVASVRGSDPMPSRPVSHRLFFRVRTAFLAALIATCTTALPRCDAQAVRTASPPPPELSRFDLHAGYGYFNPGDSALGNIAYMPINPGAVASIAGYFNRYLGVQ